MRNCCGGCRPFGGQKFLQRDAGNGEFYAESDRSYFLFLLLFFLLPLFFLLFLPLFFLLFLTFLLFLLCFILLFLFSLLLFLLFFFSSSFLFLLLLFLLFLYLLLLFSSNFRSLTDVCVSDSVMPTNTLGFLNLFQPLGGTLVLPNRSVAPTGGVF